MLRPARYLFRLRGLMINNGDVICRLEELLHLRGDNKGSSRRERVDGDLLRLRGDHERHPPRTGQPPEPAPLAGGS